MPSDVSVAWGQCQDPVLYTLNQMAGVHCLFRVAADGVRNTGRHPYAVYRCRDFDRIVTPWRKTSKACYQALREHLPVLPWRNGRSPNDLWSITRRHERVRSACHGHYGAYAGTPTSAGWNATGAVGVVLGGHERMLYVHNPWKSWAQEKRSAFVCTLRRPAMRWPAGIARSSATSPSPKNVLQAIASAVEGYSDWDNFRHGNALTAGARPELSQTLRAWDTPARARPMCAGDGREPGLPPAADPQRHPRRGVHVGPYSQRRPPCSYRR